MDLFGRKRIAQLQDSLETQQRLFNIQQLGWKAMEDRYDALNTRLAVQNRALGRLVAKIDPMYNTSEFDPKRKADSDRIGDEVIARMLSEHKLSNPGGV